ncbi:LOW QUALITY PROTEIN: putative nuclease HARBI1 [Neosynchiropus ocellatus]
MEQLAPHYPEKRLATRSTSLLACLWTLANQESYRGVADRFDMAKSTLCGHQHLFCTLVTTHMTGVITWLRGDALRASVQAFEKAGFEHIPILKPQCENALAYYYRKQFCSVILPAFCDGERCFCHVDVGHPGSWHDALAFRHTDLAQALEDNPSLLVPEGWHIIADSAYPLLPQLMKPYRDNGHLTAQQKVCNRRLNSARALIEQAFGLLKCKFRRLKCLQMKDVGSISGAVTACCNLHNLCLDTDDNMEEIDRDPPCDDAGDPQPPSQIASRHRAVICANM